MAKVTFDPYKSGEYCSSCLKHEPQSHTANKIERLPFNSNRKSELHWNSRDEKNWALNAIDWSARRHFLTAIQHKKSD